MPSLHDLELFESDSVVTFILSLSVCNIFLVFSKLNEELSLVNLSKILWKLHM